MQRSDSIGRTVLQTVAQKSSFFSSDYTTTEDTQPNLPNTIYFSVDDFNYRGGDITDPGEDTPPNTLQDLRYTLCLRKSSHL